MLPKSTPNNTPENDDNQGLPTPARYRRVGQAETFGPQPTSLIDLPDPEKFARRLVAGLVECVHGYREPAQFARWLSDDVYRVVSRRAQTVSVRRDGTQIVTGRPPFSLGNAILTIPRDGVVEASVTVHTPSRARAVALRMEGFDYRWKATSFSML